VTSESRSLKSVIAKEIAKASDMLNVPGVIRLANTENSLQATYATYQEFVKETTSRIQILENDLAVAEKDLAKTMAGHSEHVIKSTNDNHKVKQQF
jgi:hypothetical protein